MKLFCTVALFFFSFISHAQAESIVLPIGLGVDPDPSLDLTYQVIPSYDPNEKVIARWNNDKLQYFVTAGKLPREWFNHKKYFPNLLNDLRASATSVKAGRAGEYKTASSLVGHDLEIFVKYSRDAEPRLQVVHLITDGKIGFWAFVTLIDKSAETRLLDETRQIFQSATFHEATNTATVTAETPYVGGWKWSGKTPDGRAATSTVTLREDLSFSSDVKIDNKIVFVSVGYWSVSGKQLFWTHTRSEPALPDDKKQDEDEIISLKDNRLILHSTLSGEDREFIRQ